MFRCSIFKDCQRNGLNCKAFLGSQDGECECDCELGGRRFFLLASNVVPQLTMSHEKYIGMFACLFVYLFFNSTLNKS